MDQATAILKRRDAMRSDRTNYEQIWKDCYDLSFPERGEGFYGEKSDGANIMAKRAQLFDSTSTDSGQILAASMMSGGTPSNSRWIGLTAGEGETDEECKWFDSSAQTIWENIHASNYDSEGFDACLDMVAAGWFVMYCDSPEEGGYNFQLLPMSACFIGASKPSGTPDILVHEYELTAEQAVNKFGKDKVSAKVRTQMEQNKPDEKSKYVWSIFPRSSSEAAGILAKNLPFSSRHVDIDSKQMVKESGYHECPFWAPRWSKLPRTVYAVGPMQRALPDVKQLNRLVYLEDTNADIAISGMWIAEDDGVLNPRTVKIGPRKIIVANSTDSMKPLTSGANFNLSFTKKEGLQAAIRKILMADQLPPVDSPVRSATEFQLRIQQIRQILGPVFGRMQPEWYTPMVVRCFGLAYRAGVLGQPPKSLANRNFRVVFNSPMAKNQKLEEVGAVESSMQSIGLLAEATQDPSVWDGIDTDGAVKLILDGRGVPAKITRTADQIAERRDQRAQAQQQQAAQQQQNELAQKTVPIAMQQANK